MDKRLYNSLTFRLIVLAALVAASTVFVMQHRWIAATASLLSVAFAFGWSVQLYRRNLRKVSFMFDAVDNNDYAFHYATARHATEERIINESLNRILQILLQAKADAKEREKYYEMIMNSVNTGIVVINEKGFVLQQNSESLRLLGLPVFTHIRQLERIDEKLAERFTDLQPGEKYHLSFRNERGAVNLSIRVSETVLKGERVKLIAMNDIHGEMEDKEVDTWIRLTRVLTHEIMNSVTPITSISSTLLSRHDEMKEELRNGLELISDTGKGLISFVESYRRFTHIPTPQPTLFYVGRFIERMTQLASHHHASHIAIQTDIRPDDLILYADEDLIGQVVLNLLKNAIQAIGPDHPDGQIMVRASCNSNESIVIEISNNGPAIPPEEAEHIFTPFFTTKEGGSGIGLSVARQIMRLSGGSISLKSNDPNHRTTFVLLFP
ncbi:sensor histidine kinase [Tannerella forsythia]|uniref:histidine kinase n=1 Tax=Tannerella forsythia (strain ATCC 43037 / JCM 10827 / CCUG 21028 A / KCTC 5666 / FDC 338) TaxID=203275 RepID=G8UIA8_TANFA|nr:ATP-binding protein [Tannerella forsythia]AEW20875.1 ATPase/histidine kinase/DNA gyrase B/HSP90 domain protein [Tannerella forsythia 92A2]